MRKFLKILATMAAVVVVATNAMQSAATWPPEGCSLVAPVPTEERLREEFNRATSTGKPAATYCFFNPDALGTYYAPPDFLAPPQYGTPLDRIPVAICLQNDAAKKVFDEHFKITRVVSDLPVVDDKVSLNEIDARENVFIISFADLSAMETKLALCTENGILGRYAFRNTDWSWKNVVLKTRLCAEWRGDAKYFPGDYRLKARILMDGLCAGKRGDTVRVQHGGKTVELHVWYDGWTGKNVFK